MGYYDRNNPQFIPMKIQAISIINWLYSIHIKDSHALSILDSEIKAYDMLSNRDKGLLHDALFILNKEKREDKDKAIELYLNCLTEKSEQVWDLKDLLLRSADLCSAKNNKYRSSILAILDEVQAVNANYHYPENYIAYCYFLLNAHEELQKYIKLICNDFCANVPHCSHSHEMEFIFSKECLIPNLDSFDNSEEKHRGKYNNFQSIVKNSLTKQEMGVVENRIIDNIIVLICLLNAPTTPPAWILKIAQNQNRENELMRIVQEKQKNSEKQIEMHPVELPLQFPKEFFYSNTISDCLEKICSFALLTKDGNDLSSILYNIGALNVTQFHCTGEQQESLLSPLTYSMVRACDNYIKETILCFVKENNNPNQIFEYFQNECKKFPNNEFATEILIALSFIFGPIIDKNDTLSDDFLRRLSVQRLTLMTETILCMFSTTEEALTFRSNKKGKLDTQKKNHIYLDKKLSEILNDQALADYFLDMRNDLAHPRNPLFSVPLYFMFGVWLRFVRGFNIFN